MTPKEIMRMSPTDAIALHARGVGGDDLAVCDYVRWSTWRELNKVDGLTTVQRLKAFMAFVSNCEMVVGRG